MSRSAFARACSPLLAILLCSSAVFPAFQLDSSFGAGGKLTISFQDSTTNYSSFGIRVFIQPSNRILAGGMFSNNGPDGQMPGVAFVGLTPGGTLDTTFGNSGVVLDFDPISFTSFSDGYMYPDGRTLRVSQVLSLSFPQSIPKAVRLNADGSTDSAFTSNANVGGLNHIPLEVAVTADGKILVLTNDDGHTLYRLNPDGTRDNTFGTGGAFTMNFNRIPGPKFDVNMESLPDGRILLSGHVGQNTADGFTEFFLMRLGSQGYIDKSFGRQGVLRTAFGSNVRGSVRSMLVQSDGKILLVGGITDGDRDTWIMRLVPNGRADGSFGSGGVVVTDFSAMGYDEANAVRLSGDGKLRIAGQAGLVGNFLLARYSSAGILEEHILTPFTAGQISSANDLTFQPDGKILVIGSTRNPNASINGNVFAIARYTE